MALPSSRWRNTPWQRPWQGSWQGSLTAAGWGFVGAAGVVLLAAQLMGRRDLLHLAVFLLLVPTAAWISNRLFRPGLMVDRASDPPVVEAGRDAEVRLAVRHAGVLVGRLTMAEHLPASLGSGPDFAYPGRHVGGDGASRYRYELSCPHRGLYVLGPVEARATDVFGLAEQRTRIDAGTRLTVTPAPVPLASSVLSGLRGIEGSIATRMQANPSEDDVMTREYRHGDPMRRVHWAATARHGQLMVRQEESATSPEATIILDLRRDAFPVATGRPAPPGEWAPGPPEFEWAVTAAMSVAAHLADLDYTLRLLDADGSLALSHSPSSPEPDAPDYTGRTGLAAVAEGLAAILPRAGEAPAPGPHVPGRTPVHTPGHGARTGEGFGDLLLDRIEAHRQRGPLVAILGRTSAQDARVLAPAAESMERALALVVSDRPGASHAAVQTLRAAGWLAVEATAHTRVDAAWLALTQEVAPW
ncbi:DUF58 domain-containing protein [Sinomonas sp. JGH33]|uniref:DUF58 domain-containing protein n=1 Tax=Sinomonas terricola TaxID=3110330 RepID=A0ABU5TB17_9MICC|nr:DUF58 domain-containing protein [Sinomonas sp. JGH33]MEA5456717.1 DUF58 domain-containing protein [Sinomonas sp. JGH33]